MTKFSSDAHLAIVVSLGAILSFAATTKTHAATIFPPQHTEASFSESYEVNETPVASAYYRPYSGQTANVELRNGKAEFVYSGVRIEPYYRAAN